ncbi:plasmid stabilization protein [Photorhabdus luminescens]|nr:plasmid stabilization protein [Photorhabdus luminescens]
MRFEYSFAFRDQLHDRFYYLARHIGQVATQELLDSFIAGFEGRVNGHPESTPLCIEAADLGFTTYHDYVDSKLQLRAIYRFSESEGIVYPLLFLSTKQSIRQALIQYCLRQ